MFNISWFHTGIGVLLILLALVWYSGMKVVCHLNRPLLYMGDADTPYMEDADIYADIYSRYICRYMGDPGIYPAVDIGQNLK